MKKENTYIMNLEAAYIYKDILDNKKITLKNRDLNKLFSATIPYSLETIRIDQMFPNSFYNFYNKQYTKKIINVTFDKNYSIWDKNAKWKTKSGEEKVGKRKIVADKKKIRKHLYNNGFEVDGVKYVFYKRGAGKAKNGYALFIQEDMKDRLISRSRLGLEFKENEKLDLTSLLAYESLISSGIEFTIKLDPKTEILVIDDIYGKEFTSIASVTREVDGGLETKNEEVTLQNCLSDGQGLLDESVFKEYEKDSKGFMLLRNDMFKCCAFNTKLQEWFKYNKTSTVKDMFGNTYNAKDIKLVTTPNSLKFLKFAYKIGNGTEKECHQHWIENIDCSFGVVKCDKEGNYGNYNRTTYQLLNSIPNLTYDDLMNITELEREYVNLLKNDDLVFRNYILRDYKLNYLIHDNVEKGDLSAYETIDLMNCLFLINPDIQHTKKFKKMRSELISNYISNLKSGKIRVKDAKYVTLISNPYEMLLATIGRYKGNSIMKEREVYCPYYNNDQEFCATRNPHINSGNVMHTINKHHKEYDDWFNFTDNICAINFFDNDAPDRLQGCDTDSDTILIIPTKILTEKAKYCEERFPTPINLVKGKAIPRKNNNKELQKLDYILSNNYIGKIVNMSQIINSYINDAIYNKQSDKVIDELYQMSSKLSSLSQIEIDKSKKVFDNVNMGKELRIIRESNLIKYIEEEDKFGEIAKKMIVPQFFSMISNSNDYRVFKKFHTPLDILQDVLVFEGAKRSPHKEFKDLLVKPNEIGNFNHKQIQKIYEIIKKCGKKINGLNVETCTLNDKAKQTVRRREKEKAVNNLKNLKITTGTILNVFRRCFKITKDDFGFSKYSMLCLNLLFISHKLDVLKCFKSKEILNNEILVPVTNDGDYIIYGEHFKKTTIESLKSKDFLENINKLTSVTIENA